MDLLSRRVAPLRPTAGELAPGLVPTRGRTAKGKMTSGVGPRHGTAPRRVAGGEPSCVHLPLTLIFFPVYHQGSLPGNPENPQRRINLQLGKTEHGGKSKTRLHERQSRRIQATGRLVSWVWKTAQAPNGHDPCVGWPVLLQQNLLGSTPAISCELSFQTQRSLAGCRQPSLTAKTVLVCLKHS